MVTEVPPCFYEEELMVDLKKGTNTRSRAPPPRLCDGTFRVCGRPDDEDEDGTWGGGWVGGGGGR